MAETFRKGKIEDYITKLRIRKTVLKNQLGQKEFENRKDFILGEIKATELILEELKAEFGVITPDDEKPQCPKCKGEESSHSIEKEKNGWKCHECGTKF